MQISVKNPFPATVHISDYVPRKVGVKIREFTVEVNIERVAKDLPKIDFQGFKDLDEKKLSELDPSVLLVLENLNLIVCKNLIQKIETEDKTAVDISEFLDDMVSDDDFKTISETTSGLYKNEMDKIQKKTTKMKTSPKTQ